MLSEHEIQSYIENTKKILENIFGGLSLVFCALIDFNTGLDVLIRGTSEELKEYKAQAKILSRRNLEKIEYLALDGLEGVTIYYNLKNWERVLVLRHPWKRIIPIIISLVRESRQQLSII